MKVKDQSRYMNGKRVLIVEDDFFLADDLAFAVIQAGGVVQGPFPESALAAPVVSERRCDIAVLDIKLQGSTAYLIATALAADRVPFVFATGFDPSIIPDRLRTVPVWQKPYSPACLVFCLWTMLDPWRSL